MVSLRVLSITVLSASFLSFSSLIFAVEPCLKPLNHKATPEHLSACRWIESNAMQRDYPSPYYLLHLSLIIRSENCSLLGRLQLRWRRAKSVTVTEEIDALAFANSSL